MSRQSSMALGLKQGARIEVRRKTKDVVRSISGKNTVVENVAVAAISALFSSFLKKV